MICGYGGIGRRVRLRGVWETIRVQVPVTAPKPTEIEQTISVGFFYSFDYIIY